MNIEEIISDINLNVNTIADLVEEDKIDTYVEIVCDIQESMEILKNAAICCPICNEFISKELCMYSKDAHAVCSSCRREFKLVEV